MASGNSRPRLISTLSRQSRSSDWSFQRLALAFLDNIYALTQVALVEDDVTGLEMLIPDAGFKS
jgi:hypothetical protein